MGYQGQWGAYTDVESRAYTPWLRWVFVDGDYYHPLTGSFLTRKSAGTNEYSAGVNPTINWGRVVGGTLAGIAGGILTVGNPLGVAAGVALFEGLYSAAEGKPASVVVRDAVVSGALAYVGGRLVQPAVEAAAARLLTRGARGAASSPWGLPPFERGRVIEDLLGRSPQLAQNFPVIDRFDGGVAVSIKSIDLRATTYQEARAVLETVQRYINKLADWKGLPDGWGGVRISQEQIRGRVLELAIPPGATPAQWEALRQAERYGASCGVRVIIRVVP